MNIRKAVPADASGIARLTRQLEYLCTTEEIQQRIDSIAGRQDHLLLVCVNGEQKDRIDGWLQACSSVTIAFGFRVEIVGLVVDAKERRKGVGSRLVAQAEKWAAAIGSESIRVRSNVQREESHGFYAKIGYIENKTQVVYLKEI
jgi:GNAT superfamily N-acetyltransferase